VLILDDGSRDATVQRAREAGADHILSHPSNRGLAATFKDALEAAVARGADIIVNTDADNHYDQSRIPELIRPILERKADLVIGSRKINELAGMPLLNRILNPLASAITASLAGLPRVDVSTGFRAYTREAALRINVFSEHTYTHTTLISAADQHLAIVDVPIKARARSVSDHRRRADHCRIPGWHSRICRLRDWLGAQTARGVAIPCTKVSIRSRRVWPLAKRTADCAAVCRSDDRARSVVGYGQQLFHVSGEQMRVLIISLVKLNAPELVVGDEEDVRTVGKPHRTAYGRGKTRNELPHTAREVDGPYFKC
jgi:hypothetical protein